MLYLVMEHYDNGESWEDHFDMDTAIGIYESKELANKEIECIVEEARKKVDARNERVKIEECPFCEDFDRDTCTISVCFESFKKTKNGYAVDGDGYCSTYSYSVKETELNKRID